jgi:hypothetical protein
VKNTRGGGVFEKGETKKGKLKEKQEEKNRK